MTDIRLKERFSLAVVTMDWLLQPNGLLDESQQLATAVRVALGTDRLALPNEVLPDPDSDDRRGWWGDLEAPEIWNGWTIGCRNWLLTRAKITPFGAQEGATLQRARDYTREALQPFIDQNIVSRVDVNATRTDVNQIEVHAVLYRGPRAEIDLRYQLLWDEMEATFAIESMFVKKNYSL